MGRSFRSSTSAIRSVSPGLSSTSKTSVVTFMGLFLQVRSSGCFQRDRGPGELEGCARCCLRFDPDFPAGLFDNPLANREPNPVTGILRVRMQASKDGKDDFPVFGCDTDAVVRYRKSPLYPFPFLAYMNHRRLSAAKLDRVSDQVLKHLQQLARAGHNYR